MGLYAGQKRLPGLIGRYVSSAGGWAVVRQRAGLDLNLARGYPVHLLSLSAGRLTAPSP